jgi:hypothetical protein
MERGVLTCPAQALEEAQVLHHSMAPVAGSRIFHAAQPVLVLMLCRCALLPRQAGAHGAVLAVQD